MLSFAELLAEEEVPVKVVSSTSIKDIPYPQANSLDVVLQVIEALRPQGNSIYDLVGMGIVKSARQASYYYNAAEFLGFCFKRNDFYCPTERVERILSIEGSARKSLFAAMVLSCQFVGRLYCGVFGYNGREERLKWIESKMAHKITSKVTLRRRAECLLSWISWIQENLPKI